MEESIDRQIAEALNDVDGWGTIQDIYEIVAGRVNLTDEFQSGAVRRALMPIIRRQLKHKKDRDGLAFFESVERQTAEGKTERVYKQLDLFDKDDFKLAIDYYSERGSYYCRKANSLAKRCNERLGTRRQMPFNGFGVLEAKAAQQIS